MATSGTQTGRPIEIRALTGLRIVAAVWVMLLHFSWPLDGPFRPYLAPVWPVIQAGWMGVDLFFVLSGFVISWTYLDKLGPRFSVGQSVDFLWARFARVWPVWAVLTCAFASWLAVTRSDLTSGVTRPFSLRGLAEQLLMVQLWHRPARGTSSFIPPGWSLSAEWLAYCCFPVLVLLLWRLRRLPIWTTAAGAVLVMLPSAVWSFHTGLPEGARFWLFRIVCGFIAGALVGLAVRRVKRTPAVARAASIVSVLALVEVVVVCWWASWRSAGVPGVDYTGVAVAIFPVLVGSLALADRGPARWLSRETLVTGGRISFSLYLVHMPLFEVYQYLTQNVAMLSPEGPLNVLVLPHVMLLALGAAWVLHRFVEEPARVWLRDHGPSRWTSRWSRVPVAAAPAPTPRTESAPQVAPWPRVHGQAPVPVTASLPAVRPRTPPHLVHRSVGTSPVGGPMDAVEPSLRA